MNKDFITWLRDSVNMFKRKKIKWLFYKIKRFYVYVKDNN